MKKPWNLLFCLTILFSKNINAQKHTDWNPVEGQLKTKWSENIDSENVLPEYPRPNMVRNNNWINLNGVWQYAITEKKEPFPEKYQGNILVPFPIESALSGVQQEVGKEKVLWYKTTLKNIRKKNRLTLLHFGAVDWETEVYINGEKVGIHQGGFDPFTFDITPYLKGNQQELIVKVWDPTDNGPQPRGKQVSKPEGIWYTPVTGIWQTVWLEFVPETYIKTTRHTPNINEQTLEIEVTAENLQPGDKIKASAWDGKEKIAQIDLIEKKGTLKIPDCKYWSPETPFLYDLKIEIERKNKKVDQIDSYFAMRSISVAKDKNGVKRMMLNNRFLFQYGPLDQGWWPDGLYTAPTDEALKFDIKKTKEMGFNMIRKHIKVELARWYYYCDKIGMLVWQDMPSGDLGNNWDNMPGVIVQGNERQRTPQSETYYRKEWNAIMETLHNYPCIVVWVPFNEAWGQFKTIEITDWTMKKDPSRLVNSASGGNFYPVGHILDIHNYPKPAMPHPEIFGDKQALVLGEFGGLGLPINGHLWKQEDNWGYKTLKNAEQVFAEYATFIDRLEYFIRIGLSAAVYTQTTDVEIETNGLMTYDRKVIKINEEKLNRINKKLYNPNLVTIPSAK